MRSGAGGATGVGWAGAARKVGRAAVPAWAAGAGGVSHGRGIASGSRAGVADSTRGQFRPGLTSVTMGETLKLSIWPRFS